MSTPLLLFAHHSLNSDLRHSFFHPRQSDDYEKISAKYSSRLFLWTRPQYYGFFQAGIEYLTAVFLERAGEPATESRSWASIVKEKTKLTPPSSPKRESIDAPAV